jgi:hypothetical protein
MRDKKTKLKLKLKRKLEPVMDKYMFTDNRHPERGIMSAILGAISVGTLSLSVFLSYKAGGQAEVKYAAAAFVAAVFSVVGIILGIKSRFERDIFKLFPNLGIILNSLAIIFVVFILIIGLR